MQVGIVVCGLMNDGMLSQYDRIQLGPDKKGMFHIGKVDSIYRNKQPVRYVGPGEAPSIAISLTEPDALAFEDIRRASQLNVFLK